METLNVITIYLTVSIAAIIIPRLLIDWQRYREFCSNNDKESLRELLAAQRVWVARHGICAIGAVILIVTIKWIPELVRYDRLAGTTAIYGMITLMFTFAESILAQRIDCRLSSPHPSARHAKQIIRH